MRSALTGKEWRTLEAGGTHIRADGKLGISAGTPESVFEGEDRHSLAALALHGQAFGFTRIDAEALEFLVVTAGSCLTKDAVNFYPAAAEKLLRAMDVIDRLDALISPEDSVLQIRPADIIENSTKADELHRRLYKGMRGAR